MNDRSETGESVSARRRRRERAARRAAILRAAEEVFSRRGFHGASVDAIARRAEFAPGTIYLYFRDKEDLYARLLESKITELIEHCERHLAPEGNPLRRIERLIESRLAFFEANRDFFELYTREGISCAPASGSPAWKAVHAAVERSVELGARVLRDARKAGVIAARPDARTLALLLTGMIHFLVRDWLLRGAPGSLKRHAGPVARLFLEGVRAGRPTASRP